MQGRSLQQVRGALPVGDDSTSEYTLKLTLNDGLPAKKLFSPVVLNSGSRALGTRPHSSHSGCNGITVYAKKSSFSVLGASALHTKRTTKRKDKILILEGVLQDFTESITLTTGEFNQCFHNDTLTIQFRATLIFVTDPIESVSQCAVVSGHNPIKMVKLMFEDELFTDITIETGEKTFKAHRAVLDSCSDVFKIMFEIDMKEKRQSVVMISDIDPEVMADLLAYMYTGTAPNLKKLARKLLIDADKYNLPCLLGMCMNELKLNLTPANVAEILLFADGTHLETRLTESLKEVCIKFIKHHSSSVYRSESWKKLKETSFELAVEVLENINT